MDYGGANREPSQSADPRELRLARAPPWYVQPALEARRTALACAAGALVLGGCSDTKKQDENERAGNYEVEVVEASFPDRQKLAKRSDFVVTVRNAGAQTVPNVAVSVKGFDERKDNPDLADPSRPVFVINGQPKEIGGLPESQDAAPTGCETSYVGTWACGPLKPGAEKSFRWSVTAVRAGDYKVSYKVAAGLDGKAKAIAAGDGRLSGTFSGEISDAAPDTRVADDGKTVVRGTR